MYASQICRKGQETDLLTSNWVRDANEIPGREEVMAKDTWPANVLRQQHSDLDQRIVYEDTSNALYGRTSEEVVVRQFNPPVKE
jgi:hypothetical protein